MDFKDLTTAQKKRAVNEMYEFISGKVKSEGDKRLDGGAETAFILFFSKDQKQTDSMVLGSCPVMPVLEVLDRCSDGVIKSMVSSAIIGELTKKALTESDSGVQPYSGAYGRPIPYSMSAFPPETDEQSV